MSLIIKNQLHKYVYLEHYENEHIGFVKQLCESEILDLKTEDEIEKWWGKHRETVCQQK